MPVFLTRHKTCSSIKNTCLLCQSMASNSHWYSVNTPPTREHAHWTPSLKFWWSHFYKDTLDLLAGKNFEILSWVLLSDFLRRQFNLLENNNFLFLFHITISQREERTSVGQNFEKWEVGRDEKAHEWQSGQSSPWELGARSTCMYHQPVRVSGKPLSE